MGWNAEVGFVTNHYGMYILTAHQSLTPQTIAHLLKNSACLSDESPSRPRVITYAK